MKFVKRSIYLLLAIAMVFSFNVAIEYKSLAVEKMNDELIETLGKIGDTTPISVLIRLKDKVPQDKLQKALDEVYKEYNMDEFYASEAKYIGNDKAYQEAYPQLTAQYDAYYLAKMRVYDSFYTPHNMAFVEKYALSVDKDSVSSLTACIHSVTVNKEIINKMLYDPDVLDICYLDSSRGYDAGDVTEAMQYVRGDINDLGVTGTGIKVGLIESGYPKQAVIPNFVYNFSEEKELENDPTTNFTAIATTHATCTSKIITLLSPNCEIYSYALGGGIDLSSSKLSRAIETLVCPNKNSKNIAVDVINVSYGHLPTGTSDVGISAYTDVIDDIILKTGIPVVFASGNATAPASGEGSRVPTTLDFRVSKYAVGFNSICVGGMSAPDTADLLGSSYQGMPLDDISSNWTNSGSMEMYLFSCWKESSSAPNKPDLVAPAGVFSINGTADLHGTSFAAPHVTSTIAWMLARNVYMKGKSEQIRAAVLASAYTRENDIKKVTINDKPLNTAINWASDKLLNGPATENYRGAGVLNAAYCYNVAYLGQRAQFTFTAVNQTKTQNVSVSNNGLPFRFAIAWNADTTEDDIVTNVNTAIRNNYTVTVKKGSTTVSVQTYTDKTYVTATIPVSVIQQLGGGTYTVTIKCTTYNEANDVVGMTWNNLNPVGYSPYNNH